MKKEKAPIDWIGDRLHWHEDCSGEVNPVGKINNELFLWIYCYGSTVIPSFAVQYKNEYEVVLQIKDFKIIEWKYNKRNLKKVPRKHMKAIIEFLGQQFPPFIEIDCSNWKWLLANWNTCNEKYRIDVNTKIPKGN